MRRAITAALLLALPRLAAADASTPAPGVPVAPPRATRDEVEMMALHFVRGGVAVEADDRPLLERAARVLARDVHCDEIRLDVYAGSEKPRDLRLARRRGEAV